MPLLNHSNNHPLMVNSIPDQIATLLIIYLIGSIKFSASDDSCMSPFLSSYSMVEYKQSRQFQGFLLLLRLLVAATLGLQVYQSIQFSTRYTDFSIFSILLVYSALAIVGYLLVLVKPTQPIIFYHGLVIDWVFALSLPFLLPNQASIGISMALIFAIAVVKDIKFNGLMLLSISYAIAALSAGWYFNTLKTSQLELAHVIALSLFFLGYLFYFRMHRLSSDTASHSQTIAHAIPQKRHLIDGLTYLYPYHQRNLIPLSLLLVRMEGSTRRQKVFIKKLFDAYKKRLRKCDLLMQINPQHLAILLCDTSTSQASYLVKELMHIKQLLDQPKIHLTYGVCGLPFEQEMSLENILQQMMNTLNQAEHQKAERLIFINAKKSD